MERSRKLVHGPRTTVLAAVAFALSGGCSKSPSAPAGLQRVTERSDVIFLARSQAATAEMEALFTGRVAVDDVGCLRLDTDDRHTVVWPSGFTLRVEDDGTAYVISADGRRVGGIGGYFELGGGEVPALHEDVSLSPADRAAALSACPGRYWIVGRA